MKLLLLAPFPYSATSGQGGATACVHAFEELARDHEIHVLCFADGSEVQKAAAEAMARRVASVQIVPLVVNKRVVIEAKLVGAFSRWPEQAWYFRSAAFGAALDEALRHLAPEAVISQFPQMAQYLPRLRGQRAVQDVQDAYSVSWFRRVRSAPPGWRQRWARRQWLQWVDYEQRFYPLAQQCWTLSEQDRYGLTAFMPALAVSTVGLPLLDELPELAAVSQEAAGPTLGFIGAFGHPPNVEALAYLLSELLPPVLARHPALRVLIAGRGVPASLAATAPPQVEFLGFVDTVSGFYARCDLIVAPMRSGGGVKIKVAEALCHAKPVITTAIGAEGLDLQDGQHAWIADDTPGLVQRLLLALSDQTACARVADAGRSQALRLFSRAEWRARAQQLLQQLSGVARG